ncbi:hypothetical protein AX27061_3153 [Achromobacter xylosoxidans NBRC 15126 = ATCC 27061]|nr:hypothetical protein AX27061_3153 [Achromobacter xylosoxidans NBRC 15126 = ATCC 27061]
MRAGHQGPCCQYCGKAACRAAHHPPLGIVGMSHSNDGYGASLVNPGVPA